MSVNRYTSIWGIFESNYIEQIDDKGRILTHMHANTHTGILYRNFLLIWDLFEAQSPAGFRENVVESSNSNSVYCVPNK